MLWGLTEQESTLANNSEFLGTAVEGSTSQTVFVADLISEGPIKGLVDGEASVYLNGVPLAEKSDSSVTTTITNSITFAGGASGSLTEQLDTALNPGTAAERYIFLYGYEEFSGVTVTHTNGQAIFEITDGSTDFTLHTTYGSVNTSARLVKDNTTIPGQIVVLGGVAKFQAPVPFNSPVSLNGSYTLYIDKRFTVTASTISSISVSPTPAAGTYKFFVGPLLTRLPNDPTSSEDIQKVGNTNVQFRTGSLVQEPLKEVGGVGATPAIAGNLPPQELTQCSPANLPTGLSLFSTSLYPEGESASGAPLLISAGPGGFNLSPAQIAEVDELRLNFSYNSLMLISENSGNRTKANVFYDVSIRTELGGTYSEWVNPFNDLIRHSAEKTSPISFEHSINLEEFRPFDNFTVRITRLSRAIGTGVREDGTNSAERYKGDTTGTLAAVYSVIKEKFYYPYSAYAGITFSSESYSSVPERTYECYGLKVKIPTTYTTREASATGEAIYSGFWNGEFKAEKEYTDNPAWIYYDIISNNRYGAGEWIKEYEINKFALYRIARYCDELVNDGKGGLEPRFRANVYLTKATDVYKILKDMATIFTGMLYYLEGQITPVIDSPADPVYNFSKGNVIDGTFNYESTGSKTRVNQIVVTWNNPANNYQQQALVVEDRNAILRTGRIISQEAVAFGATSEGQATRYGRWKLFTAQHQTELVSFKTALQAGFLQPGDIINVQDADRYGVTLSGRLKSGATTSSVYLDRTINLSETCVYELSVLISSSAAYCAQESAVIGGTTYYSGDLIEGVSTENNASNVYDDSGNLVSVTWKPYTHTETLPVITAPGETNTLTVGGGKVFSSAPKGNTIWALKEYTLLGQQTVHSSKLYRILSIVEEDKNIYGITAVEHYNEKYDAIEKDYALAEIPDTVFPNEPGTEEEVPRPNNLYVLTISDFKKPLEELEVVWEAPDYDFIASYEITHDIPGINSPIKVNKNTSSFKFNRVTDGVYTIRVRTVSTKGNTSRWATVQITVDDPFGANVPRAAGGLAQGAISSVTGFIDTNNFYRMELQNYALAPVQTPFDPYVNLSNDPSSYSQDISGISDTVVDNTNETTKLISSYFIYFDRNNADKLKVVGWDVFTFKNLYYWYDAGNGSQNPTFYSIAGTVNISKGSNKVIGSGTSFKSDLNTGDIVRIAEGVGAKVVSIPSDELLILDRSFSTAYSGVTIGTTSLQVDFETDAIIARVYYDGAEYFFDNYLTIDPNLEQLAKYLITDSNVQFINYDAEETQETLYDSITLEVTAFGFRNPEFKITGDGFLQVAGVADTEYSSGNSNNTYTKVIQGNAVIDYAEGEALDFLVEVREGNDPDNENKQRSSTFRITKIIGGSVGRDAKVVQLTASDYSVVYDEEGENPNFSGDGSGNITLTATAKNFVSPEFKFTGDGITNDTVYGASNVKSFAVPLEYFDSPQNLTVSVSEEGEDLEEAFDTVSITAVKPGTTGYTVVMTNEAHTFPANNSGVISSFSGSGSLVEVYKGATQLQYVTGTPSKGEFSIAVQNNTGMSTPSIGLSGKNALIADFTSMTDDTEVVTYAINAENIATGLYKTQSFSKSKQGAPGIATDGVDARSVVLSANSQAVSYAADGTTPDPTALAFSATAYNTSGTVYYEFLVGGVSKKGPSTSSSYSYAVPGNYNSLPVSVEVEIREGSASSQVLAKDTVTVFGLKEAGSGATVILSNEAHTLPADSVGNVLDYSDSGTDITAYIGATQCKYASSGKYTFSVEASNVGIDPDPTPEISADEYTVSYGNASSFSSTASTARIIYTVTVRDASGSPIAVVKAQSFSKSVAGTDGTDGTDGDDAKAVKLVASSYIAEYDSENSLSSPSTINLTATPYGFESSNLYYVFSVNGTIEQQTTSNTYSYSVPTDFSELPVPIDVAVKDGGTGEITEAVDSITIAGVKEGSGAITALLSNEAHVLPSLSDGEVESFEGSGTDILVYIGSTPLTPAASGPNTFSVETSTLGGVVVDSTPSVSGNTLTYGDITDITDDAGQVIYTITVRNYNSVESTVTKVQSFSKSKQGFAGEGSAGVDARTIKLVPSSTAIKYNEAGKSPNPTSLTLFTEIAGFEGAVTYEFYLNDVSQGIPSSTSDFSYTSPTTYDELPVKVEVVAYEDGVATARDVVSLVGLRKGTDSVSVILSNEAHTVPANENGVVSSYAGSGTTVEAYVGSTTCTYGTSGDYTFSVTANGTDIEPGTNTSGVFGPASLMNDNSDTAYITFTVTVRGVGGEETVVTKIQSFTKSIKGADGADGTDGDDGTSGAYSGIIILRDGTGAPTSARLASIGLDYTDVLKGTFALCYAVNSSTSYAADASAYIADRDNPSLASHWTKTDRFVNYDIIAADAVQAKQLQISKDGSGERMYFNGPDNRIEVYDNSGTLRVALGKLTGV